MCGATDWTDIGCQELIFTVSVGTYGEPEGIGVNLSSPLEGQVGKIRQPIREPHQRSLTVCGENELTDGMRSPGSETSRVSDPQVLS